MVLINNDFFRITVSECPVFDIILSEILRIVLNVSRCVFKHCVFKARLSSYRHIRIQLLFALLLVRTEALGIKSRCIKDQSDGRVIVFVYFSQVPNKNLK